ncbi:MAG: chromate efflux transporter [Brevundimonas sp.]|uniref:chromate efflux transporter n=1 Tax=Brevundimonas sp. TaxID=1871086 RepID=UPI001A1C1E1B|nr:chromate efflux transporter [Brevundimonas sp.]MBJ7317243.1 chromate efflux transporter [Brevundimonas sp.]MDK2745792.1 chromate efflux transporter [Brevundimonas sp.]
MIHPAPKGNAAEGAAQGSAGEVFFTFLKLGLTAFGGPIAHLGYFRDEIVLRRKWLNEAAYADLVALCQFLPGPASSQVGFALGLMRAGPLGALAAWAAFTLPSAAALVLFAYGAQSLGGPIALALVHGLKLVAVAIVAQAVVGMAMTLTPDAQRAGIAVGATLIVSLAAGGLTQVAAITMGAILGLVVCRGAPQAPVQPLLFPVSRRAGAAALLVFGVLLLGLPFLVIATDSHGWALFEAFYRSGAMVFGGGHVVLPLLQAGVVGPGWVGEDVFLAGYGAAQAVPGPLFTFSAYLGFIGAPAPNGLGGAFIALIGVFLPGLLILVGVVPFWGGVRTRPAAQAALRGANAAVVGILAAALYDPVWESAVLSPIDLTLAAAGFVLLVPFRTPPWLVILSLVASSMAVSLVVG